MKYTWNFVEDEEIWPHGEFDSIEECIKEAKEGYKTPARSTIYIGETEPWVVNIDAEDILERLSCYASDELGEAACDWQPQYNDKKDIDELSEILTENLNKWLIDHGDKPSFYKIVNIQEVMIE